MSINLESIGADRYESGLFVSRNNFGHISIIKEETPKVYNVILAPKKQIFKPEQANFKSEWIE